ncbi:MAG: outer membrane lipid asymmetry maintenance protein MlaD, partial [Opitutaceae bacterium]|nr:outer membrane lipid asymmetry maintenance protein MlaD [Opitutaceae bacterium]
MKNSRLELFVGLFVLLGIAAIAYLSLKIAGGSLFGNHTYALTARFDKVTGLNPGANVVIAGVPVGRVESVSLDPQAFSAIVRLRVNGTIRLSSETSASIKTSGLIGDKYIALEPGGDDTLL